VRQIEPEVSTIRIEWSTSTISPLEGAIGWTSTGF
jgi:hypothetical protein